MDAVLPRNDLNQAELWKAWVIELYHVVGHIRLPRHARIEWLREQNEEMALLANQQAALLADQQ